MPLPGTLSSGRVLRHEDFRPTDLAGLQIWLDANQGIRTGKGMHYTAASQHYGEVASVASLQGGAQDWSIAVWVKLDSKSALRTFVSKDNTGAGEYNLRYNNSSDRFELLVYSAVNTAVSILANNLGSPSTGVWYCLTATYDNTGHTASLQVNNGTADTGSVTSVAAGAAAFRIGADVRVGATSVHDGMLDSIGFWHKVLSGAEITEYYHGGSALRYAELSTGIKTSLQSWWDLEEHTGVVRADSQGSNTISAGNLGTHSQGNTLANQDGDKFETWPDLSGHGYDATFSSDAASPLWKASLQNRGNVVRLGTVSGMTFPNPTFARPVSVFMVWAPVTNAAIARRLLQGQANNWLIGPYNNNCQHYANAFINVQTGMTAGKFVLTSLIEVAASSTFYLNADGVGISSAESIALGKPQLSYAGVGQNEPANCDLSELLIFDATLRDSSRFQIERYLRQKWATS